jgi:hypothetical protein
VKAGSSCAAVTGYDFPIANLGLAPGEGGKKGGLKKPEARSQNISPVYFSFALPRVRASVSKLLRKKEAMGVPFRLCATRFRSFWAALRVRVVVWSLVNHRYTY